MQDSATTQMSFQTPATLALEAAFDGGRITSDGGFVWLAKIEEELKLCEKIASHVPEWRTSSIHHCLLTLGLGSASTK